MTAQRSDSLRAGSAVRFDMHDRSPKRSVAGRIGGGLGVAARHAASVFGLPSRALRRAKGVVTGMRPRGGRGAGDDGALGAARFGDDESLRRLARALADPDPHKRELALGVVCEFSSERASRLLSGMLHDPEPHVRCAAAACAMRVEAMGAVFALILALDDPDAEVRRAAEQALAAITGDPIDLDESGAGREAKIEELKRWWKERRFQELAREQ